MAGARCSASSETCNSRLVRAPLQPQHGYAPAKNLELGISVPLDELEALSWPRVHELHRLAAQL